jgi:hypothetical protein
MPCHRGNSAEGLCDDADAKVTHAGRGPGMARMVMTLIINDENPRSETPLQRQA